MDWTTKTEKRTKKRTGDWTTKRGRSKREKKGGGRVEGGVVWSVKNKKIKKIKQDSTIQLHQFLLLDPKIHLR